MKKPQVPQPCTLEEPVKTEDDKGGNGCISNEELEELPDLPSWIVWSSLIIKMFL